MSDTSPSAIRQGRANAPPTRKRNRKSAKKTAAKVDNNAFEEFLKNTRTVPDWLADDIAKIAGTEVGKATAKAGETTTRGAIETGKAVSNAPKYVFDKFVKPYGSRLLLGVAGAALLVFALVRFTAPVTKPVAGAVASATPVGRFAKMGKAARTIR